MENKKPKLSEDITTLAEMGLSNARRQLEATGHLDVRFAIETNGRVRWMPMPDHITEGMNDGDFKAALFSLMRRFVQKANATATIFVSDTWYAEPTEKQTRMVRENAKEFLRLTETMSFNELIEQGYATRHSAITVVVQTAETVHLLTHLYDRIEDQRRIVWLRREDRAFPQSEFSGRQKMFGITEDTDLGEQQ